MAVAHGYNSIVIGLNTSRAAAQVIAATVKVGGTAVVVCGVVLVIRVLFHEVLYFVGNG